MNVSIDSVHFSQHVSQILKHDTNQISLPKKPNDSVPDQELLQMTLTTTEGVKKEYINKQSVALEVIAKRVQQLERERKRQQTEVSKHAAEKKEIVDKVAVLDEKYEATLARQRELIERVEEVLKNVERRQPMSEAEYKMKLDLEEMKDRIKQYLNDLLVIQGKHVYQGAIIRKEIQNQSIANKNTGITKDPRVLNSQLPNIKLMLENQ